ncbi:MAG: PDZ domain-containing protein [Acidobacteriota bacterium]
MDQREINNGTSKFDELDADGGDLAKMLRALPRVDAPENFIFRVKARIAEGSAPQARLGAFLKLAMPLALVLVVAGFAVFYGTLPTQPKTDISDGSVRTDLPIAAPQRELSAPQPEVDFEPEISKSANPQLGPVSVKTEVPGPVSRTDGFRRANRAQGGPISSVDSALRSANTISPPGFESTSVTPSLNANTGGAETAVREVFEMLGINAEFLESGWKVLSSSANSAADRAGVQAGDVIEAVDGQVLERTTTFKGGFGGKTLRVRRDGKQVNLNLGN